MKKLLYCLLLSIPFAGRAQKIELGINGGGNYTLAPSYGDEGKSGYTFAVQGGINLGRHWQLGIGMYITRLRSELRPSGGSDSIFTPGTAQEYHLREGGIITLANPALVPYIFANRKFNFVKGYAYIGARLGFVDVPGNIMLHTSNGAGPGTGDMLGLQVGYTYFITHRLGINAEVAPAYYSVGFRPYNTPWSCIVLPLTVGLHVMI